MKKKKVVEEQITPNELAGMISNGFTRVEERFNFVENRLDRMEYRLDKVENRLDGVEKRLGTVENRLDSVENTVQNVFQTLFTITDNFPSKQTFDELAVRVDVLEQVNISDQ